MSTTRMTAEKSPRHKDPKRIAYMREYRKGWYAKNKEQQKAKFRSHYKANKASYAQRAREWEKLNPEKRKLSLQRSAPKTKARVRKWIAENKERHAASKARYYKANYAHYLSRNSVRRALQRKASVNLAGIKAWMKSVKSKTTAICYYCQETFPTKAIHFDHIVPIARGGPHSIENLCVSCQPCNNRKQAKSVQAFVVVGQQILSL